MLRLFCEDAEEEIKLATWALRGSWWPVSQREQLKEYNSWGKLPVLKTRSSQQQHACPSAEPLRACVVASQRLKQEWDARHGVAGSWQAHDGDNSPNQRLREDALESHIDQHECKDVLVVWPRGFICKCQVAPTSLLAQSEQSCVWSYQHVTEEDQDA